MLVQKPVRARHESHPGATYRRRPARLDDRSRRCATSGGRTMNAQRPLNALHAARAGRNTVEADDPRYRQLLQRNFNKRFVGKPDSIRLVDSCEQVMQAVQEAVQRGLRVVARSGGCCLEGFVADPAVRVVIDTSLMTDVSYDPELEAIAIE